MVVSSITIIIITNNNDTRTDYLVGGAAATVGVTAPADPCHDAVVPVATAATGAATPCIVVAAVFVPARARVGCCVGDGGVLACSLAPIVPRREPERVFS